MGQDTRKTARKVVYERVPMKLIQGSKTIEGQASDISLGGVGLHCAESFAPGAVLQVVISVAGNEAPIPAQVVWCYPAPTTGRILKNVPFKWRMGLQFTSEAPEHQQLIKLLVEKSK